MDTSLGAGECLLLLQRLSLRFVLVRGGGSVVASHCDHCLLLEECCVFCTREKVTRSSLLSRGPSDPQHDSSAVSAALWAQATLPKGLFASILPQV